MSVRKLRKWAKREAKSAFKRRVKSVTAEVAARKAANGQTDMVTVQGGNSPMGYRSYELTSPETGTREPDTLWDRIVNWVFGINRYFALIVLLPSAIGGLYFLFLASDQYMSEARFVVRSAQQKQETALSSVLSSAGLGQNDSTDSDTVLSFLLSRDAVSALEKNDHLREIYHRPEADIFTRFPHFWSNDSFEKLFVYYPGMVQPVYDGSTGIIVMQVEAYRAQDAQNVGRVLMRYSENLVNDMDNRAQADALRQAQQNVDVAQKNLSGIQQKMTQLQIQQHMLDPSTTSAMVTGELSGLMSSRLSAVMQLAQLAKTSPNSPVIPSLKNQIAALDSQIGTQTNTLAGNSASLAGKFGAFQQMTLQENLATTMLTGATAALINAQTNAQAKGTYIEVIANPSLPDYPIFPMRLEDFAFVVAASLLVYGICWLLIAGVREHA